MNVYCLTSLFSFIQNAIAFIDIKGELTFDFYPINLDALGNVTNSKITIEDETVQQKARTNEEVTATTTAQSTDKEAGNTTATEDCIYRFPDKKQIEALLSDMMNQLTKIFVRAHEYVARRGARRNHKRFKVVSQKLDSSFFDQAYHLMSEEYRQSINVTANMSSHDPCHHQPEMKEVWRNLLERSKAILKRAAVRCVSDFIRVRNRADDSRTKEKVGQLLLREIREVRSNQLKLLCDDFNLCYKDLLY